MTLTSKFALGMGFLCLLATSPTFAVKHEVWFEARSPHFVVICNASEKQALKTARQFEQIRSVFRQYIMIASSHPSPVITIFAVKDENSLRALLPEYWATKGHSHPAGIFFYNLGQFEAAVQLDAQGPNPYEALYHEYYHSLTMPYFPALPVWLAEGLADFFGNSEVTEKEARLGEPDPNLIEGLRENRLIPLDVLFKVDHASPYYNEQNKTSIFYAESWALTHYFMLGDNGSHKRLLLAYLQALQQDGTQNEAATKAFGDLNKLQKDLQRYINGSSFFQVHGPAPPPVPDAELKTREISDAEVDAYLGGFAALRGHPQDAKPLLDQALQLDPKLALAYQNLGLTQLSTGQRSAALASFSQAVELDPKNALTRYLRAYLSFGQRTVSTGDAQIEDDLHQAIALDPDFAPSYGLLAVYLAASNENLPEALAVAQKGVSIEPGNALYALSLAQVLARMGRFGDAENAARTARANATNPAERANADQFLAYIQRARDAVNENRPSGGAPDSAKDRGGRATATVATTVDGQITEATCSGSDMLVKIVAGARQFTLHTEDYAHIDYYDDRPGPRSDDFQPCTQLRGHSASVIFSTAEHERYDGELQSVEIKK